MVFWIRILAVAQVALLARRHLQLLEADERSRLAKIVAKSKGRPSKNLSANEREEMLRLVRKLEPGQFGRGAFSHVRGGGITGRKK
jgi:predicted ArsR family transcriptional regulator